MLALLSMTERVRETSVGTKGWQQILVHFGWGAELYIIFLKLSPEKLLVFD